MLSIGRDNSSGRAGVGVIVFSGVGLCGATGSGDFVGSINPVAFICRLDSLENRHPDIKTTIRINIYVLCIFVMLLPSSLLDTFPDT